MPVDAGIAIVGAGIAIYGAVKKNQDAKKAAANVMPTYNIPQSEYDNQRLAEANAGQGMSDPSPTAYNNQSNDALSAGIGSIERSGGDPNAIGNLYNNYSKGAGQLAIYDDQRRLQNLNTLMGQNQRMSANTDKSWQVNNYAPWANRAQALAQSQQGDQALIGQGIGLGTQGLIGAAKSLNAPDNPQIVNNNNVGGSNNFGGGGYANYNASTSDNPTGTPSMSNYIDPNAPAGQLYSNAWSGVNNNGSDIYPTQPMAPAPTNANTNGVNATNNFTTWGNGTNSSGWVWNGVMPVQQ